MRALLTVEVRSDQVIVSIYWTVSSEPINALARESDSETTPGLPKYPFPLHIPLTPLQGRLTLKLPHQLTKNPPS